jgi:adenylate cyclase
MILNTTDQSFLAELLRDEGVEYACFDTDKKLTIHSDGLVGYLLSPPEGVLFGAKIHHLFPEFIGYEGSLQEVLSGATSEVMIERVHRADLNGKEGYVTLHVRPRQSGLLLIVRDATTEGQLEQKVTQQRNELSLLSGQLSQARAQLDDLFRRFVPSAVVDDMLSDTTKTELGGQRREITVLFADLRGFTGWSEAHEPEQVMDVLNNALQDAVQILLEAGATLDKFMGDALLAIFNAPNAQPDHADRALDCARRISLASPPVPALRFGIGINTGLAVVGNIGTQQAMNYTVLGDAVNIAKRLEEITEPGQVLIGPGTHELADPEISRISIGQVRLRGKQNPISAYELLF